jgi:hypothetical protein
MHIADRDANHRISSLAGDPPRRRNAQRNCRLANSKWDGS